MPRFSSAASLFAVAASLALLTGCPSRPKYPECNTDDDCKEQKQVCVNGFVVLARELAGAIVELSVAYLAVLRLALRFERCALGLPSALPLARAATLTRPSAKRRTTLWASWCC